MKQAEAGLTSSWAIASLQLSMPVLGCPQVIYTSPWQAGTLGQWVLDLDTFTA